MWYCALDEHAFNHIPPGLAVLLLGPYYTTYLEVDLDEEEIPTGMERARGYSRLSYCGEIAHLLLPQLVNGLVVAAGT